MDGVRQSIGSQPDPSCTCPSCLAGCLEISCGPNVGSCGFLVSRLALAPASVAPRPPGRRAWPRKAGVLAIRAYQRWLSPRLPVRCPYVPSCSSYGRDAVERYGLVRGCRVILARLARCTRDVPLGTADPLAP